MKMHKAPDKDLGRAKEENWKKPKKDISIFLLVFLNHNKLMFKQSRSRKLPKQLGEVYHHFLYQPARSMACMLIQW